MKSALKKEWKELHEPEKVKTVRAAVVKWIDYGVHHPESSQGGGIKNKNMNK